MKKPVARKTNGKVLPKRPVAAPVQRTSQGLRDVLFDEITSLRGPDADPRRAMAVASLAKQIVNTVRVELDVAKEMVAIREKGGDVTVGTLALGGQEPVLSVGTNARAH